jgi:hypothetical protein
VSPDARAVRMAAVRLTNLLFCVRSELEPDLRPNQEERVLIWTESAAQAQPEADLHAPPEDVPCLPLIRPVTDAMSGLSSPELRGNPKRPRLSPTSLYSEVPTKPATSMPAMVIPHLVSHRTATSPRSMIFDS